MLPICGGHCSFKEPHRFFSGQATHSPELWSGGACRSFRRVPANRQLWGTSFRESDSSSHPAGCGEHTPASQGDFRKKETKDGLGPQLPRQTLRQQRQHRHSPAWWAVRRGVVHVQLLGTPTEGFSPESCPNRQLGLGELDIWA